MLWPTQQIEIETQARQWPLIIALLINWQTFGSAWALPA
jgi:hypothetical protein